MKNIIIYFLTLFNLSLVQSTHFYGGTVTWKPLNNTDSNPTIPIMFTQSYQWRRSYIGAYCNESYVLNQSPLIPTPSTSLLCVTTPSSLCGGYGTILTSGHCTDFSALVDSSSSQISTVENIAAGSKFCVAFTGTNWVLLTINCGTNSSSVSPNSTVTTTTMAPCYNGAAGWSIGCCIDLSIRPDGFINTPPVASIMSPIKIPINTLTNIQIPVIDADNDVLRCRWAQNTSVLDECNAACGEIAGSTLDKDNCTLTFDSTGKIVGNYYAVTLMIEDFYTASTTTPFSSIPIQFLIEIVATPICPLKPTINSNLSSCTPIQVGIQFNITILITQGCSGTTIVDFVRMPPLNMYKGELTQVGSSNVWTITETWIPTSDQIGSQAYCAIAIDSANITSDQYCTTFTVVPIGQTLNCPNDFSVNGTLVTSTISSATTGLTSIGTSVPTTSINQPNSLNFELGLGLGLGVPLLLLSALALYCCCSEKCNFLCAKRFRRCFKRTRSVHDENHLPDYRQQYINDNQNSYTNFQINLLNETQSSNQLNSTTSAALSDFESNYMNMTRTSFYSPSVCSLPIDNVQYTRDYMSPSIHSMQNDSILMRAYSVQESRKHLHTS